MPGKRIPVTEEGLELCAYIQEFRLKHELTVRDFARLAGVCRRTVQLWERKQGAPYGQRLIRLRRLFESYDHLDMRDRKKPPEKGEGNRATNKAYQERRLRRAVEASKAKEQKHGTSPQRAER